MARPTNKTPGQRPLRVGEEIRHALTGILRDGDVPAEELFDVNVTVTEVRIGPDMKNATAFVMPLGGQGADEIVAALNRYASRFRGAISRRVTLRHTPTICFALDGSFDEADRIDALFRRKEVARDLGKSAPAAPDDDQED